MNFLALAGMICLVIGLVKSVGWLAAGGIIIALAVLIEMA